ncbi:hypothetical protein [Streptomyces sp. FIT100]|uniref:hypothetical protein n=1 Tax=Streptomyces sp. FIT100 TaxID=2837956 RepID=UPI0021C750C7|nr:hypothetical protein [Streptomyces sp. FIT100]UUN29712.1 hypothetical protein KK483_27560 [Streptomyces sp. FIT100]
MSHSLRDAVALGAALIGPPAVAAALVPLRAELANATLALALLLLVVGLVVSQLAARARRLQVITVTDAGHLARIHETARLVQAAGSPDKVVEQEPVTELGIVTVSVEQGVGPVRPGQFGIGDRAGQLRRRVRSCR